MPLRTTAVSQLPVAEVLDDVAAALRRHRRAVLVAPPGSGKTTLVPPFLLTSGLCPSGEIVVLQPRRVAARTVARRIAAGLGEAVGGRVGYQVRFDKKTSDRTRIRVVTEGILTAWLQRDPELTGVAAVVLDELHERSLHADLALALVKEVQEALRDDLLLVVMSATLDAEPVAAYLDGCPVVSSDGRLHPVAISHLERAPEGRLEDTVVAGVLAVIDGSPGGDILTFLPGVREIEAARRALVERAGERGWDVAVLHGRLDPAAQDAALDPGPRPRVILATNIAETSLTISGVAAVVDSGLAKVMRFEPSLASGRLTTERISRASAEQRAGRAGRLGPGRALRLWTVHDERTMAAFDDPEIRRVDLTGMALELRAWGVTDAAAFPYFEAPEPERLAAAEATLATLGAIDALGGLSALGRRIRRVPASPRVAAFLVAAADAGALHAASRWAAALELRGAGEGDLAARARTLDRERHRGADRLASQLARAVSRGGRDSGDTSDEALAGLLLAGYADRVARRRTPGSDRVQLVGGRGARIIGDPGHHELIVALDVDGGRRGEQAASLVRTWVAIDEAHLRAHRDWVEEDRVRWDEARSRAVAERVARFGDLVLARDPVPLTDRVTAQELLLEHASRDPAGAVGTPSDKDEVLLARLVTFARAYPERELPETREAWIASALPILCSGRAGFEDLRRASLRGALMDALAWDDRRRLDAALPERLEVPSGSRIAVSYQLDGAPVLAVKVQELFGLDETPRVADGRIPCVVHLLNPAGRPLQVTSDLASFWTRTWPEVRAEMRSRYPKHRWPEDPTTAVASRRTTKGPRR